MFATLIYDCLYQVFIYLSFDEILLCLQINRYWNHLKHQHIIYRHVNLHVTDKRLHCASSAADFIRKCIYQLNSVSHMYSWLQHTHFMKLHTIALTRLRYQQILYFPCVFIHCSHLVNLSLIFEDLSVIYSDEVCIQSHSIVLAKMLEPVLAQLVRLYTNGPLPLQSLIQMHSLQRLHLSNQFLQVLLRGESLQWDFRDVAPQLSTMSIKELQFDGILITGDKPVLEFLTVVPQLESLNMSEWICITSGLFHQMIPLVPHLNKLYMTINDRNDQESFKSIAQFPALHTLYVQSLALFRDLQFLNFLASCPTLRQLFVSDTKMRQPPATLPDDALSVFRSLTQMDSLCISSHCLHYSKRFVITMADIVKLCHSLQNLHTLKLDLCGHIRIQRGDWYQLKAFPKLQSLYLSDLNQSDLSHCRHILPKMYINIQ